MTTLKKAIPIPVQFIVLDAAGQCADLTHEGGSGSRKVLSNLGKESHFLVSLGEHAVSKRCFK